MENNARATSSKELANLASTDDQIENAPIANYIKRLATTTYARQRKELELFEDFLNGKNIIVADLDKRISSWSLVTYEAVIDFLHFLVHEKRFALTGTNMRLHTIKKYCQIAKEAQILDEDEYTLIKSIPPYKSPEILEAAILIHEEVNRLLQQPDTAKGRRDKLILSLLLKEGLWPMQISRLKVNSINLHSGTINLPGEEYRIAQLDKDTLSIAKRYIEHEDPAEALFPGNSKEIVTEINMSDRAIYKRVHLLGIKAGLPNLSPQDCHLYWLKYHAIEDASHSNAFSPTKKFAQKRKRPDVFDRQAFEKSLREQGASDSFISPVVSDFKILMPLLIKSVGEKQFFEYVEAQREDLRLGPKDAFWDVSVKYIYGWAEKEVAKYIESGNSSS